ncbi:Uncharacterized protein Fot_22088 [Forsythia ovata]|uniref:Uncharacterized protein n=1 Tax=Forsythia ovata TaxID=205694 RepID=A0ABD1UWR3_9LAMI
MDPKIYGYFHRRVQPRTQPHLSHYRRKDHTARAASQAPETKHSSPPASAPSQAHPCAKYATFPSPNAQHHHEPPSRKRTSSIHPHPTQCRHHIQLVAPAGLHHQPTSGVLLTWIPDPDATVILYSHNFLHLIFNYYSPIYS